MGRLPTVIIAGFQKCGTTALHEILCTHPEISRPHPAPGDPAYYSKELHFFNDDSRYANGLNWYRERFPEPTKHAIDSTPEYARQEKFVTRIRACLPDVKLILLMRDPVERAFSAWNHWQQLPPEEKWGMALPDGTFEDNIEREIENLEKGLHTPPALIERGLYANQIEVIDRHFPPQQVYLGFSADLLADQEGELRSIFNFIGVEEYPVPLKREHSRRYDSKLSPATREELREVFAPYDEPLRARLGRPIPWLADQSVAEP